MPATCPEPHGPESRCMDCATDDEILAAIPPPGYGFAPADQPEERRANADVCYPIADEDVTFPGETGSTPQGVTRWRKRPVEVDMILWDGSEKAWQLIANHGGLPERCSDGSLNIWVEKSQAEMNLDPGSWAVLEPDGSGVYPCTAAAQAATYDPASSPDPAGDQVTVSMADLIAVLGEAEGFIGGKDNPAFARLAAAAGVQ